MVRYCDRRGVNRTGLWSIAYFAVFNSLVYRFLNTPLKQTEYTREYEHILNTVVTNGFDKKLVDKMITNFRRLKQLKIRMSPIKSLLTIHGHIINLTKSSDSTTYYFMLQNKFSKKNLLNSNLKDNIPPEKKSGIYQINCKIVRRYT